MAINPFAPKLPEMDIALLSGTGQFVPNSPGYPEIDITLLPGVPNQQATVGFKHSQSANSNAWTIQHNLNFYPNVTVFDSSGGTWQEGNTVEGDVVHIDKHRLVIHFSMPVNGTAILS